MRDSAPAGPADLHQRIASEHAASDNLPCAAAKLPEPLKGAAEFAAIRARVANDHPLDAWQEDDLHFFVFELRPASCPQLLGPVQ